MSTVENVVRTVCHECHSGCGVLLHVKDGKIERIEGDKSHPIGEGFICPKGQAVKEIVYHPDRLIYPLKRAGSKGEGKWERITWDETLDAIATKLTEIKENYGPEAIVMGTGTSRGLHPYLNYFMSCLGSPNRMSTIHLSGPPITLGTALTYGFSLYGRQDYENTQCVMLWGNNPPQSNPEQALRLMKALRRGAKLIVIDPRRSEMASRADIWLQIRPGTDCALALAMLNVIIEEGLYDKDFVDKWTYGFDRLRHHVKAYSPEEMTEVTWIPTDLIKKATRLYVQARPSCVSFGVAALCQHYNSIQTNRAIAMVIALTGNLEVPGGNVQQPNHLGSRSLWAMMHDAQLGLSPEQARKRLGADRFRIATLEGLMNINPRLVWEAILTGKPYPVKAVILFANNALIAYGNSSFTREALMKLDFLVSVDYFMNPTAELADLVLPAAHWSERDEIVERGGVFARRKAVEPLGECWDEKKILVELAKGLGLQRYWKSVGEALDYRLELSGITFEQLKQQGIEKKVENKGYKGNGKFNTPSGKCELYSEQLERLGLEPIPTYHEPPESPISTPELAKDYPLILTTGARHIAYFHSGLRNIPSLRKLNPEPTVDINPAAAESLGIKDGDWVLVETPRGSITRKAKFFEGIHPKVIHVSHGWWYGYEPEWKRVNVNILTDNSYLDSLIGSEPLKGLLCRVRPITDRSVTGGNNRETYKNRWQMTERRNSRGFPRVMCPGIREWITPKGGLFLPAGFVIDKSPLKSWRL